MKITSGIVGMMLATKNHSEKVYGLITAATDVEKDLASYREAGFLRVEPASVDRMRKALIAVLESERQMAKASDELKIENGSDDESSVEVN